ncbi:hypothetical protein LXL04_008907 [Taraxacum kok-saghyz]
MIIPVRCFTCGKVIGNKWDTYLDLLQSNYTEGDALDALGLVRYCCRRMLMTHVDLIEKLLNYNSKYKNVVYNLSHYFVPELGPDVAFSNTSHKAVTEFKEAKTLGVDIFPVLVGRVSYLLLSKPAKDVDKTFNLLSLLDKILPVYKKGDYFRYVAEFKSSEDCMEVKDQSLKAYEAATTIVASDLSPTHPIRLGLALNFSMFYYEILNSSERDVSNNNIYGEIPYGLPLNLTNLNLACNNLSEYIP